MHPGNVRFLPRLVGRYRFLSSASATNATSSTKIELSTAGVSSSKRMVDQKRLLAMSALEQVPLHGWTQDAITAAVLEHPHMSISMSGMLTPTELIQWLMDDFNYQLREDEEIKKWSIFQKIQWRLEQIRPLAQSGRWHEGMAMGLTTPLTTRNQLHEFVELVAPPDSTTMYKTALGGIFLASELHFLGDTSPGYDETWAFLKARLDELEQGNVMNMVGGAAATASNGNISMAAAAAVSSSLLEGISSLVLPLASSSAAAATSVFTNNAPVPGTKPSDYQPTSKRH